MPTQLYSVSGSPRSSPPLTTLRIEILAELRKDMQTLQSQLMGQLQQNLEGMTSIVNQEVCALRSEMQLEMGNLRSEIQLEFQKYQQELQDIRTFTEKNVRKRPAPLRLSPGLPTTVAEAPRGYHQPTAASAGHGVDAADRV